MQKKSLVINGVPRTVISDPEATLGDVLRRQLTLTGTKVSCNDGHCGACSAIVDGKLTLSCITKMKRVRDGAVRHSGAEPWLDDLLRDDGRHERHHDR